MHGPKDRLRASRGGRPRGTARLILLLGSMALVLWALGCSEAGNESAATPERVPVPEAKGPRDVAVIDVAGFGEIHVELLPELAPRTVAHFESLVREGFYDGTTFHRVVPGFVVQGGDPRTRDRDPRNDGTGGREQAIQLERSEVSFARGMVAMANRRTASSSGPQFFITLADQPDLDGDYALFGRVVSGMEVVDAIARTPIDKYGRHGPQDRPLEDVVMKVRIEEGAGGRGADLAGAAGASAAATSSPGSAAGSPDELDAGGWDEGTP